MYLHAYGKSGLESAIKRYGGVANLRPAFTIEIKQLAVSILPQLLLK